MTEVGCGNCVYYNARRCGLYHKDVTANDETCHNYEEYVEDEK